MYSWDNVGFGDTDAPDKEETVVEKSQLDVDDDKVGDDPFFRGMTPETFEGVARSLISVTGTWCDTLEKMTEIDQKRKILMSFADIFIFIFILPFRVRTIDAWNEISL